jgi:gliding motility-associated-like protein
MKNRLLPLLFVLGSYSAYSQVVVGKKDPTSISAQLEVFANNRGVLIPRVELLSSTDTVTMEKGNVNSLLVFNTATAAIAIVKKTITPDSDLIIYNAVSPNGDGINDSFYIKGIDKYPDNRVEIYNRWGVKVYDATSYNENDVMFKGYSDGRSTVKRGEGLPAGTYFYVLKYNKNNTIIENTGYLYIANDK